MHFSLPTDNFKSTTSTSRGMTLIEILFSIGIISILFIGIYGLFKVSIDVVSDSKARAGALALAVERMEQIRSLPYASVGTSGGIPSGSIAQTESVSLNQTEYTRRTFIEYADDPADGVGAADTNGITADYKTVKVEMIWSVRGTTRTYSQVSSIVPVGIESLSGGGTLRIQVYDALSQPVSSATVRIVNTTGTSTVDVTTYTNVQGFVTFPGTPAGTGYQVTVSKSGYSTAQTYTASGSNPNPTPGHLSVAQSQTTSGSFFIDRVASLSIRTLKPIEEKMWEDEFDTSASLTSLASTTVTGGGLSLGITGSDYFAGGTAIATSVAPTYLSKWKRAAWNATVPAGTSARVKVYYDFAGTPTPLPDAALAGNSAGFATSPVDLTGVSTSTYPSLALYASLTTSNPAATPDIRRWEIDYDKGPMPIANIPFSLQGSKTIGTTGAGASIYKFLNTLTTDSAALFSTSTIEWDIYTLTINGASTGYDISEACSPLPIAIAPATTLPIDLYLSAHTTNSLLVAVKDSSTGNTIEGATIRLTRTAVDTTQTASACGQTFFSGLSSGTVAGGTAYTLAVSKAGYQSATVTGVEVAGATSVSVTLTPQ